MKIKTTRPVGKLEVKLLLNFLASIYKLISPSLYIIIELSILSE